MDPMQSHQLASHSNCTAFKTVNQALPLHINPNYIAIAKPEAKLSQYETLLLDHADTLVDQIIKQIVEKLYSSPDLLNLLKIELKHDKEFSDHLSKLAMHVVQEQCPDDFQEWKNQDPILRDFEWCTPDSDNFLAFLQNLGTLSNLSAERMKRPLAFQKGYQAGLDWIKLQEKAKKDAQLWTKLRKKLNLSTLSFTIKALKWVIELTITRQMFLNKGTLRILMSFLRVLKLI